MIWFRRGMIAAGVALGSYGLVLLVTSMSVAQLMALGVWLAAMIVVHDGMLAPAVSWLRGRWYRRAHTRPRALTAVVHIGFVVGGVLTLFVLPEIWAQGRGNANPTILVGDYALRLLVVWAAIGAVVVVVARVAIRRSRR